MKSATKAEEVFSYICGNYMVFTIFGKRKNPIVGPDKYQQKTYDPNHPNYFNAQNKESSL
jgi:hypothetical protein